MPHKVNPIDFENSEANMGISNALLQHLALTLPVSRLQRDLTDSSTIRNMGTAIAHSLIGLSSCRRGLGLLEADREALNRDLDATWQVLAEPIQTLLRKTGDPEAYERLKDLTRGLDLNRDDMRAIIEKLDLPAEDKRRLMEISPQTYIGLAPQLARSVKAPAKP
jgi:adenylosuccinate lyase